MSLLTPWERVTICRHPERPKASDYIRAISDEFIEIFGDRTFRDDPAIVAGFARIGDHRFMVIGQEKGSDLDSRLHRNFGMSHPEGYRKALRCMKLAEKFSLPVAVLIDTPGAYPGLAAEERGQGWAVAMNLREMAFLKTPVIALIIGEGCSGGALGVGVADVIGMLQHAYYSVISPEGCASILWKSSAKKEEAAQALKMHAEELIQFGIIDEILQEPPGGAHMDTVSTYHTVRSFFCREKERLENYSVEELLSKRYEKFRKLGKWNLQNQDRHTVDEIPVTSCT